MSVEWWGFDQGLNFRFPSSVIGYLIGGIAIAILFGLYFRHSPHAQRSSRRKPDRIWTRLHFLVIVAPILNLTDRLAGT